jgi:hypothetical protein
MALLTKTIDIFLINSLVCGWPEIKYRLLKCQPICMAFNTMNLWLEKYGTFHKTNIYISHKQFGLWVA